jgi:outer membrane receptor protein involved in Fe transport
MSDLRASFCFLSVSILLLCVSLPVFAETPTESLPEVVISSTRLPGDPVESRTVPTKVTVITAEDIEKAGAKSVQEAIQYATGIVMYDQVGNAFQQTVDLRGFNGQPVPATSVFVDGVRINEPDFNTASFEFIPIEMVERIEILPGASAIYGKNALGGSINIITKRGGTERQATAETLFGSFQRERYSLNSSGPLGKFDYFANFTRETEAGFRDDSGARISRFAGRLGYRPTQETDLSVSYNYVKNRLYQAGSLPLSVAAIDRKRNFTPGDFFDSETNFLRANGHQRLPLGFSLDGNIFYRQLGQEQFTVGQTSQTDNVIKTESKGGALQLSQKGTPFGHQNDFVLGSEATRHDFGNRASGFFFAFPGIFPGLTSTNEDILGVYAQDTFHLTPKLLLTGGGRYDHDQIQFVDNLNASNNGSKRYSRITPRAGVTFLATSATSLYFNYSQGFRVPTPNELFATQGLFGTSNPTLQPVRSTNYELGAKTRLGAWGEGAVALFQSDVRNEILLACGDPTCFPGTPSNINIDKSRRRGIESTLKIKPNQYLDGVVNYTYTVATIETDLVMSPVFPLIENVRKGDTFPQVPKHRLGVTGNYHPAPAWTVSMSGLYVSTQFHLNDEQNTQPRLPGYFVLNGRVSYERVVPGGRLSGFLMVNNLLDQKYSTQGIIFPNALTGGGALERFVVPAPGIAFYGGLSYRFEGF